MNYYVFRIDYGNNHKMIRNKLFKEHELRQGWGGDGFDLNGLVKKSAVGKHPKSGTG